MRIILALLLCCIPIFSYAGEVSTTFTVSVRIVDSCSPVITKDKVSVHCKSKYTIPPKVVSYEPYTVIAETGEKQTYRIVKITY